MASTGATTAASGTGRATTTAAGPSRTTSRTACAASATPSTTRTIAAATTTTAIAADTARTRRGAHVAPPAAAFARTTAARPRSIAAVARIAPRRAAPWFAITGARALVALACAACSPSASHTGPVSPAKRGSGPTHDPDHVRGALPTAAERRAELAGLRRDLDAMYAHRLAKIARYHLDEDQIFRTAETRLLAADSWVKYDSALYETLAQFHDAHLSYHPPITAAPSRGYTSFRLGLKTVLAGDHLLVYEVDAGSDVAAAGVLAGLVNRFGAEKVAPRVLAGRAEGTAPLGSYRVLVSPKTLANRKQWRGLVAQADGFSPPQQLTVQGVGKRYPGKIAVVVDAGCVSWCETVVAALRAELGAVLIGDTTAGSSGAPLEIPLGAS